MEDETRSHREHVCKRALPTWDSACEIVRNQEHKVVSKNAERRRGTKALRATQGTLLCCPVHFLGKIL